MAAGRLCFRTTLFLLILLPGIILFSSAKQVVLLDTTQESVLDWTRFPPPETNSGTQGWIEESFTNFDQGINWRSYVVCDVHQENLSNFLWTPFIERGNAKRIYIEVKFSMRDCSLYPGTALTCKETFSLLYREFDAATKERPPWTVESYTLIDRIAADEGRFSNHDQSIVNVEVRSISVTKKGIYIAFRDQGACISLLAVKVYYITCPNVTINFAFFPETPTGHEITAIEQTYGQCVPNSVQDQPPKYLCKGDGSWSLLTGGCQCIAGYEPVGQSCKACISGKYKHSIGGDKCVDCPANSFSTRVASSECRCVEGFLRASFDSKAMPCTKPPGSPRNVTVVFVDQSTVYLSWLSPLNNGGRSDTTYRIFCDICSTSATYVPGMKGINDTQVAISGLHPRTNYHITIYAENGVSEMSGELAYAEIFVMTEAAVPSQVTNIRVNRVKPNVLLLAWDPPKDQYITIDLYEVRYFVRRKENNASSLLTADNSFYFENLQHRTEYGFQVRGKTATGWGEFSQPVYTATSDEVDIGSGKSFTAIAEDNNTINIGIVIGVTVALLFFLLFIIVAIIVYLRRNKENCSKKQPSDCDTLEYRNGEVTLSDCFSPAFSPTVNTMDHPPIIHTASMTTPLFTQSNSSRTYVDPHTYEDPNQAVREFTREIDASHITIEAIIGGGEFGDVCRGKLKIPGKPEMMVAIKTLKPGSSDKARLDFLTEASIMGQFEHLNVIFLQGVVTKSNPVMIITEYMENGSLDTFLRANDGKFQVLQLVAMLRGIAAGMQYLSEMNYVHRDLAARNVLVNASLVCKIADFGLSREIESTTEGAYTTRGGKIPVRWTAPEAIAFRKFTSASDVWSFGIVAWEVMSYGERPYWNWSNQDVIKSIEKGYRLPPPMDCPEAIHQLMLDTWQKERSHRPTFAAIVKTLDKLIRCPESLRKIARNRNDNPFGPDAPDMTQFTTVEEWLNSIKMTRYLDSFEQAGITTLEAVARLTIKDLTALGVTLVGHQKKIMNSVQTMRAQMSANMSEGFLV